MGGNEDELVNASESLVDLIVVAPIVVSTFDHSIVVTMGEGVTLALWDKYSDEAFKTDGLGPGDVLFSVVCVCLSNRRSPFSPNMC